MTMQVTYNFTHTEEVIPPRCRKSRRQRINGTYSIDIREITNDEAPIAIIEHDSYSTHKPEIQREFRYYDDRLWSRDEFYSYGNFYNATLVEFPKAVIEVTGDEWKSYESHKKTYDQFQQNRLIVDGVIYASLKGEPRILVESYTDNFVTKIKVNRHFEYQNTLWFRDYFRIDQVDLIDEIIRQNVLIFDYFPHPLEVRKYFRHDILIPECLKLNPQADRELLEEQRYQEKLIKLKDNLRKDFRTPTDQKRALQDLLKEVE